MILGMCPVIYNSSSCCSTVRRFLWKLYHPVWHNWVTDRMNGCIYRSISYTSVDNYIEYEVSWGNLPLRSLFLINKKFANKIHRRLDFQPVSWACVPRPHTTITGLHIVFFDQSQPRLLKSSRLPFDWSILSLFYPTWRILVPMSFLLL